MPKKKKNNRLDNLFKEIDKEVNTQADSSSTNGKKSSKQTASVLSLPSENVSPEPLQSIDFPVASQEIPAILGESQPITAMLSTAFRTDKMNWATLKIVDESERQTWGNEEQLLVKQVADQLSLALENARLFEDAKKSAFELSVLNEFGSELATLEKIEQVAECVYKYTSQLLDTSNFYLSIYDLENDEITPLLVVRDKERIQYPPKKIGNSPTDYILKSKESLLVNVNFPKQMKALGIDYIDREDEAPPTCFLGVPLLIGQKTFGALGVQSFDNANLYQEHHRELLTAIASQAAIAIQNVRSFEETQERNKQLASLNEIIVSASHSLDLSKMLSDVLQKYLDAIEFDIALISLFNLQREQLELLASVNLPDFALDKFKDEGLSGTLCESVYEIKDIHFIENIEHANEQERQSLQSFDANIYLGVPLELRGATVGTLCAFRHEEGRVDIDTINLAISISRQIGFSIENAQLFEDTKAHQTKLSEALQVARMGYFEYDLTNGIITITDEMLSLVGTSSTDEGGNQFPLREIMRRFVAKEDRKAIFSATREIIDKPDNQKIKREIRFITRAGETVWVEIIFTAAKDEKNKYSKILGSSQDITERKKSDEALRRRNEYLAASSEIGRLVTSTLELQAIFSRSVNLIVERFGFYHASIFIIEETGFNAILQEATGKIGEKLKKQKHSLAVGSNSTVGKATSSGKVVAINNTAIDSLHKYNPFLPETKAEAAIPLRIGNRIIGALDIQSKEVNAFSEDEISILQLLADQIAVGIDNARSYNIAQQAVEEMREVDRLKSQFLANMSHELRTPLNSIIGFARVILKGIDGPITELQKQDLTAIFNSGQHLLGLINDILDLSRIEAGKMELTFDQVNMTELITSVMSTATGLIKDKPIELKREIPEDLPLVRADAMRVRQVLINFLSNAAKFTDEGEIIVKAQVDPSSKEHPMVMISVTDTGPGIAQEDQPKLFQPFSQVDASLTRKVGGSGLGLSICQHLIQMHGGKIGVHSSLGKGSTFYFSVPIYQSEPETEGLGTTRVILAIDDDPKITNLYERYLKPKGYQVVGLNNPSKAKERVKQLKPTAITLDIMMPGYDGWQVLADLKSSEDTRNIPVIICSIVEEEEKGFILGAADYLVKPILEDDLLNSLDRLNGDASIREVLVINNNPADLRMLGKMISDQGKYKAILAEGGPSGWRSISSKSPHAVVLDLFMPEMDGFTFLEQMRKDKKLRDIPVVVITDSDLTKEQHKQLDSFGKRLLQKSSLKERDLIATIEHELQKVHTNQD